jgi:hypothetical protein
MQFDARNPEVEFVQCAVCENGITGGRWFARVAHGEWMVALCCPLCFGSDRLPRLLSVLDAEFAPSVGWGNRRDRWQSLAACAQPRGNRSWKLWAKRARKLGGRSMLTRSWAKSLPSAAGDARS